MTTPRCKKQGEEEEEAAHYPPATYRWMTAVLVGGHLAETAVQLFLVLHYWPLCGRWAAGLAVLLATAVVVINAASIVAVRRGLDFTDRWFGQCLCYVMHVSLLALVWRFLKLTFLYDRADLREFALLRFIQVHLQTLPSLLIQTCLIYQHHGLINIGYDGAIPIGLAITQLMVAGLSISLSSLILSTPPHPALPALPAVAKSDEEAPPLPARNPASSGGWNMSVLCQMGSSNGSRSGRGIAADASALRSGRYQMAIATIRSVGLLFSRTVAVGVFMTEFHVWTLIVFGVHWCIALLWLVLQDSASESGIKTPSPAVSLFRRALVAYVLVFDWPPRYQQKNNASSVATLKSAASPESSAVDAGSWLDVIGLGGRLPSVAVALYYGVTAVENAAMLSLWFHFAPASPLTPPVARLTTLASCTAAFTLGVLCVVASAQHPPGDEHRQHSTPHDGSERGFRLPDASGGFNSKQLATVLPVNSIQRQRTTVQAQIHRGKPLHPVTRSAIPALTTLPALTTTTTTRLTQSALNMAANHSHPESSGLWDDDGSSNSRNTNTLEGPLLGGSASGSGLGSCSIPYLHPSIQNPSAYHPPVVSTRPSTNTWGGFKGRSGCSPFRDPSTFTASQSSFSTIRKHPESLHPLEAMVKRPYISTCPRSSTPRAIQRRNSSGSSSLPSIAVKVNTVRKKKTSRKKKKTTTTPSRKCHCRIFDQPSSGILIKEIPLKSATLKGTSSGRMGRGFEIEPPFRIQCATCLGAHDPLLSSCLPSAMKSQTLPAIRTKPAGFTAYSTDYPSASGPSSSSSSCCSSSSSSSSGAADASSGERESDVTYTTCPPAVRMATMERLLSANDPSPWNYVNAWLVNANQGNTHPHPAGSRKQRLHTLRPVNNSNNSNNSKSHNGHFHPHAHNSDVYCTVPPRLGQTVKELSFIRAPIQHHVLI